jgi:predicted nucleotidyltransferase
MVSEETIKEAAMRIVEKFHPERINLFGSYARGVADEKSDVDLLVISPLRKKRRALILEMNRSLWGLGLARDIVILTQKEFEAEKEIPGTIARYAFKEGKLLYERNKKITQSHKAVA